MGDLGVCAPCWRPWLHDCRGSGGSWGGGQWRGSEGRLYLCRGTRRRGQTQRLPRPDGGSDPALSSATMCSARGCFRGESVLTCSLALCSLGAGPESVRSPDGPSRNPGNLGGRVPSGGGRGTVPSEPLGRAAVFQPPAPHICACRSAEGSENKGGRRRETEGGGRCPVVRWAGWRPLTFRGHDCSGSEGTVTCHP